MTVGELIDKLMEFQDKGRGVVIEVGFADTLHRSSEIHIVDSHDELVYLTSDEPWSKAAAD